MNWIWILITSVVIVICLGVWLLWRRKLDSDEKLLIKLLKKSGGEIDPRFLKLDWSRDKVEDVAGRLEEKGKVVRWGWRAKSLICLKRSVVKNEKKVVKLLKRNGGMMGQFEAGEELGYDRESFGWRMVRKLEAKGVVEVRTRGKKNLLFLIGSKKVVKKKSLDLNKREKRLVKILKKNGGEMLDVGLDVRMRDSDVVIRGLVKEGVVFRWGNKKRNICLREMLNEEEEVLMNILKLNDGKMMWRELVKKSGYCGKGFHRVLDKLEMKGKIIRRKVGRSVEVEKV